MKHLLIFLLIMAGFQGYSNDSTKVKIGAYLDTYFGYDFNQPADRNRLYFVSSARHNEFNLNLGFLDFDFQSENLRFKFRPAIGTYMAANYATEPTMFKNIYEAYGGVCLSKSKNIWLEMGIFSSPFTNENAISKEHLVYTRSFAPEYVPYYLSGAKLIVPLNSKLDFTFYVLNGWQVINETNNQKSLTTQFTYKANQNLTANLNIYVGNEKSDFTPQNRERLFSDIYVIYNKGKFSGTSCFYIGKQNRIKTNGAKESAYWQNFNLIGQYAFKPNLKLSGRIEYFNDLQNVQITPIANAKSFNTMSASLCVNLDVAQNAIFRLESRSFYSEKSVYFRKQENVKTSSMLIGNLTFFF